MTSALPPLPPSDRLSYLLHHPLAYVLSHPPFVVSLLMIVLVSVLIHRVSGQSAQLRLLGREVRSTAKQVEDLHDSVETLGARTEDIREDFRGFLTVVRDVARQARGEYDVAALR